MATSAPSKTSKQTTGKNSAGKGSSPSHSTIYVATSRDYDRMKVAQKHELKHERDYERLERQMISHAKWNQRAESNHVRGKISSNDQSTASVDEWMRRERTKKENIEKAKQVGNERIRPGSLHTTVPKV